MLLDENRFGVSLVASDTGDFSAICRAAKYRNVGSGEEEDGLEAAKLLLGTGQIPEAGMRKARTVARDAGSWRVEQLLGKYWKNCVLSGYITNDSGRKF